MRIERHRRGSAIIFVLAIVFIASILSVYMIEYSVAELRPRASSGHERSLRTDAYSALNAAVAVLEEYFEIDKGLFAPSQGWEYPLADKRVELASGGDMVVKITDESAKIPLRELKSADIVKILEEMKISESTAQKVADSIIDWTDSNDAALLNGAERTDYDNYEAFPPNRSMKSLSELRYVQNARELFFDESGEPTIYFKTFSDLVSVENFAKVNLNTASPEVLYMLMILDGKTYDESLYNAIRGRSGSIEDGIVWIKNKTEAVNRGAREVPSRMVACQPQLLKIEVTIKRGVGEYYLCAYYGDEDENSSSSSATKANSSASGGGDQKQNSGSANKTTTSGTKKQTASKSTSGGKQSDSASATKKSTSSKAKSSNSAVSKGGKRKIIKLIERGSR